jgi:3-mercaptopyruvate sulfurtransferase SseA
MQKGFTNASALLGGTAGWKQAGYPMQVEDKKPADQPAENKKADDKKQEKKP